MNKKYLFSFIIVLVVTAGLVIYYQSHDESIEESENLNPSVGEVPEAEAMPETGKVPETEELPETREIPETEKVPETGESRPQPEEERQPVEDELGVFNLSRAFMTGLESIVNEEGTGESVLDLTNAIDTQLSEITEGLELTDDQQFMVDMLLDMLSAVRDLVQNGEAPSNILGQIRPSNRPN